MIGTTNIPAAGAGGLMVSTASTTFAASDFANAALTFVASEVYATLIKVARSIVNSCLNPSKN